LADGHPTHHNPNIEFLFDIYPWGKTAIGGGLMLLKTKIQVGHPPVNIEERIQSKTVENSTTARYNSNKWK
jgi:hypothetical protein